MARLIPIARPRALIWLTYEFIGDVRSLGGTKMNYTISVDHGRSEFVYTVDGWEARAVGVKE